MYYPLRKRTLFITRLSLLIALTLIIQICGLPQPITGPLINAMFFITTTVFGWLAGVTLGCLTPLIALVRGQLPPIFAPMIPFIAASNALLILVYFFIKSGFKFSGTRKLNPLKRVEIYLAIIVAAVVKFLFLSISVKILLPILISHNIPHKLTIMMTIPQLITALIGGVIALSLHEILHRAGFITK